MSSTSYQCQVEPFKDGLEDHVYDKLWQTLPPKFLFRVATAAGIGPWRLTLVCRGFRESLLSVPRKVRFLPQAPEERAEQIAWLRKCGTRAEGWRLEAMGDKGAAGVSQALRCNTSLVDVGVYRGRRKEATREFASNLSLRCELWIFLDRLLVLAVGLRGASKIAIAILANEGVRLQRLDLSGSTIKDFGAEKLCRCAFAHLCSLLLNLYSHFAHLGGSALSDAATTLLGGSTLAHLDLARNEIEDKGVLAVAAYIAAEGRSPSNGQALRHLNLTSNNITEEGAAAIAGALASGGSRIGAILLTFRPLFAHSLLTLCSESITLSENDLGSEQNGPATLVRLMMHTTMQTIQLSDCSINVQGAFLQQHLCVFDTSVFLFFFAISC